MSAGPSAGREVEADLTDDFVVRFLDGVPGRGALQMDGLLKTWRPDKAGRGSCVWKGGKAERLFRAFPNLTHSRGEKNYLQL